MNGKDAIKIISEVKRTGKLDTEKRNEDEDVTIVAEVKGSKESSAKVDVTAGSIPVIPVDDMTSNDYYFDFYAHLAIHETMLKDEIRTETFRDAMYHNKHLFKGKTVLDIGCGTGILSMFAAKAGAARVIGIDCSNIAQYAKIIVKASKLDDIITIVQEKVEDIVELPHGIEKVDVIVSEWMGYCLFFESMLESVLYARDKWLVPNGVLFPDKCALHIFGIEDRQYKEKIRWWQNVYGFDMSCLQEVAMSEPIIRCVDMRMITTTDVKLLEINLNTMVNNKKALKFDVPFTVKGRQKRFLNAMVTFFTVEFSKCHKRTWFSTGPDVTPTHWKQTVFHFDSFACLKIGDQIHGRFSLKQNARNNRDLDFEVSVDADCELGPLHEVKTYRMR